MSSRTYAVAGRELVEVREVCKAYESRPRDFFFSKP